jgi:hypothetical protein
MKVLFMLPENGLEAGPKFERIVARVRFFLLAGHDVQLLHSTPHLNSLPIDSIFVDEANDLTESDINDVLTAQSNQKPAA